MKNTLLTLNFIIILVIQTYSQSKDTIIVDNGNYIKNDMAISKDELKQILLNNPASANKFKKYNLNLKIKNGCYVAGSIVLVAGILEILASRYETVDSWGLKQTYYNTSMLTTGVVICGGSISLAIIGEIIGGIGKHHLKKSIELYNSNLKIYGYNRIKLNTNPYGIGISMNF